MSLGSESTLSMTLAAAVMGCEPSITTEQNKLSSYPRFSQMRFDALLILFRQTANDFRNALALARSGQLMRAIQEYRHDTSREHKSGAGWTTRSAMAR